MQFILIIFSKQLFSSSSLFHASKFCYFFLFVSSFVDDTLNGKYVHLVVIEEM